MLASKVLLLFAQMIQLELMFLLAATLLLGFTTKLLELIHAKQMLLFVTTLQQKAMALLAQIKPFKCNATRCNDNIIERNISTYSHHTAKSSASASYGKWCQWLFFSLARHSCLHQCCCKQKQSKEVMESIPISGWLLATSMPATLLRNQGRT